jgi:hypothetical protein
VKKYRHASSTPDNPTLSYFLLPQAVENMRNGMLPKDACTDAVRRIMVYYKSFQLGLVCLDMQGGELHRGPPFHCLHFISSRHQMP